MKLKINKLKSSRQSQFVLLVAIIVVGVIALIFTKAATVTSSLTMTTTPPASGYYDVGQSFSVLVYEDAGTTAQIQAVNLGITYNPTLLQITPTDVDGTGSGLELIKKSTTVSNGIVEFASYGNPNTGVGYVVGKQFVAKLTFKILVAGSASIGFEDNSTTGISTVTPYQASNNIWDHVANKANVTLTNVDTTGPSITGGTPASGTVHDTQAVSATITDVSNVTGATLAIGTATPVAMTASGSTYSYSWNTTTVADGSYALKVTATDGRGNTGVSTIGTVNVVNSKPDLVVSAVTLSPTSPKTGQTVTITATIKNQGALATPAGVANTTSFKMDGTAIGSGVTGTSSIVVGGTRNDVATWTATAGTHSLVIAADSGLLISESNDNNNSSTTSVAVSTPDTVAPIFTSPPLTLSPATSPAAGTVTVTANVSDTGTNATGMAKVEFFVDGNNTAAATATTSPFTFSWNTATVADGSHTISAKAYDKATPANVSTSSAVSVTVKNAPASGDVTGDGHVTIADLNLVLTNYGTSQARTGGDLNGNGKVDYQDLLEVLNNWGA